MIKKRWMQWWAMAVVALVCASLLGGGPRPDPAAAQNSGVELAVYNSGIALIQDRRSMDLTQGVTEVRFSDVAALIDPTSVHFESLTDPKGTSVLEQNYEYDVVGSAKLLRKYVDKEIRVVANDGKEYTGTLLNGDADVILQTADKQVVVLKLDQIKEFGFPALPEGLITRPTLVWLVDSAKGGVQDVEVSYLTSGISWTANYVLVLANDEKSLDLGGWVTLDNQSGASYNDAALKLIAGDINRVTTPAVAMDKGVRYAESAGTAAQVQERGFFEYHLYEVKRPVTVKDQQTKQIEFVTASQVPAVKFFVYDGSQLPYYPSLEPIQDPQYGVTSNTNVNVMLEFSNDEKSGMGVPLPKGTVRVLKNDVDGSTLLVGEDSIDHTPKDERVQLYIGDAFDIVGERKQADFKANYDDDWMQETYEITLRNHKDTDVEVRVVEHLYRWSQWTIAESSQAFEKQDAQTIEFRVPVKANGEVVVTYTVKYEW